MYEDRTPERIKAEALAKIEGSAGLSAMAGGFADAVIGPVAEEISKAYMALSAVPSMVFPDEGSGGYIDLVGEQNYNITRRSGTRAVCDMRFTGEPGVTVPQGTTFLTAGGLAFALTAQVTLGEGSTASGRLEAALAGSAYNVGAGTITRMYANLAGLTGFTNGEAAGGTDPESDAALLARVKERARRPATSGNGYQYRQWAMEVPGVGNAKVVELPEGPGTVGLTLVDGNYGGASAEIVAAVEAHIAGERPVGALVSVQTAEEAPVTVAAAVALAPGGDLGAVRETFTAALQAHIHGLIDGKYTPVYYKPEDDRPYTLLYNRVLALLLSTQGVENFTALTVNGGTADVVFQPGQIPALGEVAVT